MKFYKTHGKIKPKMKKIRLNRKLNMKNRLINSIQQKLLNMKKRLIEQPNKKSKLG